METDSCVGDLCKYTRLTEAKRLNRGEFLANNTLVSCDQDKFDQ